MESTPEAKSLTDFLEALYRNESMLLQFVQDRETLLAGDAGRGLSAEDHEILLKGKLKEAKQKLEAEGTQNAPQRWIVIWVV